MDDIRISRRSLIVGALAATAAGVVGHLGTAETGAALPAWARTTPQSREAYRVALAQRELMASLACYCGCVALSTPHLSLLDCFVRPDGSLEAHAAGCGTCQEEAIDAADLARAGVAGTEIRRIIDERYGERGPSTDDAARRGPAA